MAEDVLTQLDPIQWRSLTAPCESVSIDFSHSQARRLWPYIDGAGHDHTGMDPLVIRAILHFENTIEPDLFPTRYNEWQRALFDGSSGLMVHPILGFVKARVMQGTIPLDARSRSGITVDVTWETTVDDPAATATFTSPEVNLASTSEAAETAAGEFDVIYPAGQQHTSLLEAVQALNAIATTATFTKSLLAAQIRANVDTMLRLVETANDHAAWPAADLLSTVYVSLREIETAVVQTLRATKRRQLASSVTLNAFADHVSNTLSEVAELNPHALARPLVPKGTVLTYYTAA